jgi:Immunoglobulin I-set domain./Listeria-Bacteroides repeat domain (List_Bact_rpt).
MHIPGERKRDTMKNKKQLLLSILLVLAAILVLMPRTALADPPVMTIAYIDTSDGSYLKSLLESEKPYTIVLRTDIDYKINTEDPYWCTIKGKKIIDMNGHGIKIHNDDVYESTLFKIPAGATLIITANANDDADDVKITYNGYINDDSDIKFRNLFEVYGTLVNNGANLHAGRSKEYYTHIDYGYKQTLGRGVCVKNGGSFVMNYGRVYGRGETLELIQVTSGGVKVYKTHSLCAILADAGATVLINGGEVYGKAGADCFDLDDNATVRVASGFFETSTVWCYMQNGDEHWGANTVGDVGLERKHIAENSIASYKHADGEANLGLFSHSWDYPESVTVTLKTPYFNIIADGAEPNTTGNICYYRFMDDTATIGAYDYSEYFPGTPDKTNYSANTHEAEHKYEFTWVITENNTDEPITVVTESDRLSLKNDVPGFDLLPGKMYSVRCVSAERVVDPEGETALVLYGFSSSIDVLVDVTPGSSVPLTAEYFPDDIFRAYLAEHYDLEEATPGYLSKSELKDIVNLYIASKGISSLQGIEYLPYVKTLDASDNHITYYDGSGNPHLMDLDLAQNPLTGINLTNNSNLRILHLQDCDGASSNLFLDLTGCPRMNTLHLTYSDFRHIDISKCWNLINLVLNHDYVVNSNSGYRQYDDPETGAAIYQGENNPGLLYVAHFDETTFPDPVFRDEIKRRIHDLQEGDLLSSDLAKAIQTIYIEDEDVYSLDGIRYFTNLTYLDVTDGELYRVDLSNNKKLQQVYLFRNRLYSLNVSGLTELKELYVYGNQLYSLDVSGLTALECLDCGDNRLNKVDVSDNVNLKKLVCGGNCLKTLDVSGHTALKELYCGSSFLESIDLSGCTELLDLVVDSNWLSSLSLAGNKKLRLLDTRSNNLITLDISSCSALNTLVTGTTVTRQPGTGDTSRLKTDVWGSFPSYVKVDSSTMLITNPQLAYAVVTFETNGGSEVQPVSTLKGYTLNMSAPLTSKPYYSFGGWFTDPGCTNRFIFDQNGTVVTEDITLYAAWSATGPDIQFQPEDVTVTPDNEAVFSIKATGEGTLTYKWQTKAPNSSTWKDSTNATATKATFKIKAQTGHDGFRFRCIVTDSQGRSSVSQSAMLSVVNVISPLIVTDPADVTTAVGNTAIFSIAVTGIEPISYQWQILTPGSVVWKDSNNTSAKYSTFKIRTSAAHNGYKVRCVVTDANGKTRISGVATLTLTGDVPPVIKTQPKDITVAAGATAKFQVSVTANGTPTYQWQTKAPNSSAWKNSTNATAKKATFQITAQAAHNGYQFRCIITSSTGKTVTSNAATLTVTAAGPSITTQPADKTVAVGASAKFTVAATGTGTLTYQWQTKAPNSSTWKNSTNSYAKKATFQITAQAAHNGYQFRCIVTDGNGATATSAAATLTVTGAAPVITKQPANTTVNAGETIRFTVSATGTGTLTYQWQTQAPGSTTWKNSTNTTAKKATFQMVAQAAHNGYKFRCIVTDANGIETATNAATLTVN